MGDLDKKITALTDQIDSLEGEKKQLKDENARLSDQLNQATDKDNGQTSKIADLEKQLEVADADRLQNDEKIEEELAKLRTGQSDADQHADNLKSIIDELQKDKNSLKTQIQNHKEEKDRYKEFLDQ